MKIRRIVEPLLPPLVMDILRAIKRAALGPGDGLTYAPNGWQTELPAGEGWNSAGLIARWRKDNAALRERLSGVGIMPEEPEENDSDWRYAISEHNTYMTYAYVLALAARQKKSLKILDYGGNVGDYYWIGQALLPGVALDYHCKELSAVAEAGRELSPEVIWHESDACFEGKYDLVMFNASLQYIEDWKGLLRRCAPAIGTHLFVGDAPVVRRAPSHVTLQRLDGEVMRHHIFNKAEVIETVEGTGLRLVREFLMGKLPPAKNAPEPFSMRGWLFQRDAGA